MSETVCCTPEMDTALQTDCASIVFLKKSFLLTSSFTSRTRTSCDWGQKYLCFWKLCRWFWGRWAGSWSSRPQLFPISSLTASHRMWCSPSLPPAPTALQCCSPPHFFTLYISIGLSSSVKPTLWLKPILRFSSLSSFWVVGSKSQDSAVSLHVWPWTNYFPSLSLHCPIQEPTH